MIEPSGLSHRTLILHRPSDVSARRPSLLSLRSDPPKPLPPTPPPLFCNHLSLFSILRYRPSRAPDPQFPPPHSIARFNLPIRSLSIGQSVVVSVDNVRYTTTEQHKCVGLKGAEGRESWRGGGEMLLGKREGGGGGGWMCSLRRLCS